MGLPIECDILLHAGVALLNNDAGDALRNAAIAVKDGCILDIGSHDLLASHYLPRRTIGSDDHIAMPGLINTHNHTILAHVRGRVEDLGFAPAYIAGVPQGDDLSPEEAYLLARLGVFELLRFGTTTLVDFYRHPEALARATAEAGLRGFIGGRIMDADMCQIKHGKHCYNSSLGQKMLEETENFIDRWKVRNDLINPAIGFHAADTCSTTLLAKVAALALETGLSVHTHLHQSQRELKVVLERDGCRPIELFNRLGMLGPHLIAGHCIWMQPEDIDQIGSSGTSVAHSPIGNATHGAIAPVLSMEAAGAHITLCTDSKSGDMFEAMRCAVQVARIDGAGFSFGAERVLRWATQGGATALGLNNVGSLIKGWKADILLLNSMIPNLRPLHGGPGLIVYSASGGNVDYVVVDGKLVLDAGQPCHFDPKEVIQSAQLVAERLWATAKFS
ncbi:amidohydrolase family protein [Acidithiobacillus sulfurivorans]|uniref:Amidohydrolase family protein n=1 Tax=Acidithiobacillus sulfurivorans TaxID=1958756 RepID=A0ABS5ZWE6_9PROT|nr:amidohydrolase family protein [Acidithiobacillus sulfurivorans]MBU2759557.1 amidohydrolase family protein [Acidithiobacillus sulfurivorans]